MGPQSITHPSRHKRVPLRIALFLLLCFVLRIIASAQTPISALTVPLILPSAIVFDAAGNLYFAETGHHLIHKLDTLGNITTIAGTGIQGFFGDGGPATSAILDSPQGLALDTANNLYIADTHNHRIRKLNLASGTIVTVAGTGTPGFSGDAGPAASAQLDLPTAIAFDAAGDLYISDTGNHRIRELDLTTNIITTIAGTGTQGLSGDNGSAMSATIDSPTGLAVDVAGNIYLADTHNHLVRKIAASTGTITTIAGNGSPGFSGDNAVGTSATLALPHGLSLDAKGNIYLADTENHRIRRIDATSGIITTAAGDGTQAFSGDGGPAVAASLDSPSATSLSPASLLTLSDTSNQRIRQLAAQPASSTTITTIAGLGISAPEALTLSAPATMSYGSGQLSASLTPASSANGSITFFDITNATNAPITLGTAALIANVATLPIMILPAGAHTLTAAYSGDQTHPSAQSQPLAVTITPLPLSATSAPVNRLYGQPTPAIIGTISGILPQDAANITTTFTTIATSTSPAGSYPIIATLSGPAAGNYIVTMAPVFLTVSPAPTSITLSNLVANAASGSAVTLTAYVASSSTTVAPTGSVTLLDSTIPLSTTPISTTGAAVFTINSLAAGSHTLTAVYDGSTNFTPSSSSPQQITIGTGSNSNPDFILAATGAMSQTIVSGTSASFTFSVQMQGNLSSAITLGASGLPNLATASFNPPTLPPGINTFTLTIATPNTTAWNNRPAGAKPHPIPWALLLCPIVGVASGFRKHNTPARLVMVAIVCLPLMLIAGCGDRINAADALALSAKTYTIMVTGTATAPTGSTLQHSATVTLILAPSS